MPLDNWTDDNVVSVHEVYLAFLKAEKHKIEEAACQQGWTDLMRRCTGLTLQEALGLIDSPTLDNATQNHQRLCLLYLLGRWKILSNLPPDTKWFRATFLEPSDLNTLNAIAVPGNSDPENPEPEDHRLPKVVDWYESRQGSREEEFNLDRSANPEGWDNFILWGHERNEELTILEGNHRLISYHREVARGETLQPFRCAVYVGLSPLPSCWHRPDHFLGIPFQYPIPGG
jgi:hypothetical protein